MFDLNNLNGCELVTLANIIAISLSQNLTSEEMAIIAGFLVILSDSLATLSLFNNNNNNCSNN